MTLLRPEPHRRSDANCIPTRSVWPINNGNFTLKVVATATESANGNQVQTIADLNVTVLSVNDAPVARAASYTLQQGGYAVIDLPGLVSDADDDLLALGFTQPRGGTLKLDAEGRLLYMPRTNFFGADSFSYTVYDGYQTATATVSLWVNKKIKSATLMLQSTLPTNSQNVTGLLVMDQGGLASADSFLLDWEATAPEQQIASGDGWMADFLAAQEENPVSLAELTGLVVRL